MPKIKDFKTLKRLWYSRLEKSGFHDVENKNNELKSYAIDDMRAGANHGKDFETIQQQRDAKIEYFRLVGHFLHEHKFEDSLDFKIWTLHGEGLGVRDIALALKRKRIKFKKSSVHNTVMRLKKQMLERYRNQDEQE